MFLNYLFTALLYFRKQPGLTAIKLLSLALGLVASILVLMHVQLVQSSNKHIDNWENTYRLITHLKMREINQPYRTRSSSDAYAEHLKLEFPEEIEYLARIRPATGLFGRGQEQASNRFLWAEPDVVELLGLEFVEGDSASALNEPNSLVLSETTAAKYFGAENPLGKVLTLNDADLQVTGVIRDQPDNASHPVEMAVSAATGRQMFGPEFMGGNLWLQFAGTQTFLRLREGISATWFNENMPDFVERRLPEESSILANDVDFGLSLQPVNDIWLNPLDNFAAAENNTGKLVLGGLTVFALMIMASSCINYVNLALAQATQRRKEIGVRKSLGASRTDVVWQLLLESLVLTLAALLIAIPLVVVVLPIYGALTGAPLSASDLFESNLAITLVVLAMGTGIVAGVVPAMTLARIEAARIFRNTPTRTTTGRLLRSAITASQFTISTILILLAVAIYLQTQHLRDMDVGFDKNNLVIVNNRAGQSDERSSQQAMLDEMRQHPGVQALATSNFAPPGAPGLSQWYLAGNDPNATTSVVFGQVSVGFIETYGFELLAGRSFSEQFPADLADFSVEPDPEHTFGIVITDLLANRFGIDRPEDALGEVFVLDNLNFRVIGVVRQFRLTSGMESDQRAVGIMIGTAFPLPILNIRLDPLQSEAALSHIDAVWQSHRGGAPIDRAFYTQSLEQVISDRNEGLNTAALIASIITIAIAAMGLYALASYAGARRTKEVGIRKVLGSSSRSIVVLFAWDFTRPVMIACLFAWPVAWYCANRYYAGFSSQATFSLGYYLLVSVAIVTIAALSVVLQCSRAANSDPVRALRYE